ncbi:MAG: hypoxanthine phosphoribosyltransferase [Bradymonadaceae bacterium]|nr:hypoxanthine phosphoribosyltransferase [Lujinxingiaceae bacterium]
MTILKEKRLRVLISAEEIDARCKELGAQITKDYAGQSVHLVGVLKGCVMFLSDLARQIDLDVSIDFLGLSSYGASQQTSGVVRMTSDLSVPIKDRHVLVVEDIIDTGLTMKYLLDNLRTRLPASVAVCTLLYKPENLRTEVPIEYIGFTIPNEFVIGYGLDYAELYRNLPYIGVVVDNEAE